ncbi:lipopolysaccharide heptosyltransferase II [Campylobacter helveticus]|uniref:lipopolysaccharide heptosyltransferase II n=1 Tax=Campylobacter helveticus TaxID=28898 RepID=UPI00104BA8EB|nr:lipopolysaccharide heptosyltransferase II [Campylobacter helveticus]MCR2059458.1 lipopolysaccharide heptosyltransferase II [Campylobacter helveticus]MCR2065698.1 lipopolysaccharide heptosyltransferase II [Campylobacter helveticus]QBL11729.1 lipopolysaccharide heptosyltransferase II [Campylobacter helveticus]TNB61549.1 lipopolysaccharide heptosyltransferase II [Campylobacter helveticus]TNB63650.1 lipopolysaccharide heptosyltransferase II [Campylobacter helveticus]
MKIFINLPTWLGDTVMASAAIYGIKEKFKEAEFIFFGSFVATGLFKEFPNSSIILEDKKKRYKQAFHLRQNHQFDLAFSFRSALSAKLILKIIKSKKKFCFNKKILKDSHQVLKYLNFIEHTLNFQISSKDLKLPIKTKFKAPLQLKSGKKILALNPGASYGSAKRWDEEYFAKVGFEFAKSHEIIILGAGKEEAIICARIANILAQKGVRAKNLCNKTSIQTLAQNIALSDIFLTNDSGAMHIGAALKVKMLVIFGPTKFTQTSPWQSENAKIIHLNLACMPCMKRTCILKHHKCMKDLSPKMVIEKLKEFKI